MIYSFGDEPIYLGTLGDIHGNYMDAPAVSADDLGGLFCGGFGDIRNDHVGTIGSEQHSGSLPDAASGPGDDGGFSRTVKGGNLNRIHGVFSFPYKQRPLSVMMACPVMQRDKSLARNAITLA